MKKLLKALGITAVIASVLPYRVHRDEETETTAVDALLWQATRSPGQEEGDGQHIDVNLGFKSPFQAKREEHALFADDEPEAAIVAADLAQAEADAAQAAADEAQAEADLLQAAADEAQAAADDAAIAADEAADSDPEA